MNPGATKQCFAGVLVILLYNGNLVLLFNSVDEILVQK